MTFTLKDRSGNSVRFEEKTGHLTDLILNGIDVLHRAPWLNEPDVQNDTEIPLVERRLQGDFFCAPFGKSDLIDAPIHGETANSPWIESDRADTRARFALPRSVMGATITKTFLLEDGAFFQTHQISGGDGGLPVAHHPMVHMANGGRLSFSPKQIALTPDSPLEPERHWLSYPAEGIDLKSFPGPAGPVDLSQYPQNTGHEDFITLAEAPNSRLGWTAISRVAEQDLIVIVKDPRVLPITMLWYSNGGRDYTPWNGRHIGVLGVEDGCTAGAEGHRAAVEGSSLSRSGIKTCLALGATHVVEHAIYAVPISPGPVLVKDVRPNGKTLVAYLSDETVLNLGPTAPWMFD